MKRKGTDFVFCEKKNIAREKMEKRNKKAREEAAKVPSPHN
jgi:hypothetical protein